jgi:hypothetical protein
MTDEECSDYLDQHQRAVMEGVDPQKLCDSMEEKLKPVREAIASGAMRQLFLSHPTILHV